MSHGGGRAADATTVNRVDILPLVGELIQIQDRRYEERKRRYLRKNDHVKLGSVVKRILLTIWLGAAGIFLLIILGMQLSWGYALLLLVSLVMLCLVATPYSLPLGSKLLYGADKPYPDLKPLHRRASEITDELIKVLAENPRDEECSEATGLDAYLAAQGKHCPNCRHESFLPFSLYCGDRYRREEREKRSFAQWALMACPNCRSIWVDEFTLRGITTFLRWGDTRGVASNHFASELAIDVCKKCASSHVYSSFRQPDEGIQDKTTLHITMTCEDCDSFETRFFELSGYTMVWQPGTSP